MGLQSLPSVAGYSAGDKSAFWHLVISALYFHPMFTGIVQNTGEVLRVVPKPGGEELHVKLGPAGEGLKPGDSLAVSGVCLTAVEVKDGICRFDVITETLSKTTLGTLGVGSLVNLERSLQMGDRLDGHLVQGHVDGVGKVVRKIATAQEYKLWIEPPESLKAYVAPRGSVSVDGVSLTIAEVEGGNFAIALIPTTLERTQLGRLEVGSPVNLESDIIARQVVHWLEFQKGK